MNNIRAIIIDNEIDSIESLKIDIEKYCKNVDIISIFTSATAAIMAINEIDFDLIFLDIRFENENMKGFEIIERIERKDFVVIFISAHPEQYGHGAWDYSEIAVGFLAKPISPLRLIDAVALAKKKLAEQNSKKELPKESNKDEITITVGKEKHRIKFDNILCVEGDDNYIRINTRDGRTLMPNLTLNSMEESLRGNIFLRVHRSWIINCHYVQSFIKRDRLVKIENCKTDIPVGETYYKDFIKRFPDFG